MIVSEFRPGQFVSMTANKEFRTGRRGIKGVILNLFSTNYPVTQVLKSGSLDVGQGVTVAQMENLSNDPTIVVPQLRVEQRNFLAFNIASGMGAGSTKALQDAALRDAIGYALDQKTIVDRAFRDYADPGVSLLMPVAAEYYSDLSDIRRPFDLKEAARRLDVGGYRNTNGDGIHEGKERNRFQLKLITGTVSGTRDLPLAVVQLIAGWLGQIGSPVSVTQFEWGALNTRTGPWPMAVRSGICSLPRVGCLPILATWSSWARARSGATGHTGKMKTSINLRWKSRSPSIARRAGSWLIRQRVSPTQKRHTSCLSILLY